MKYIPIVFAILFLIGAGIYMNKKNHESGSQTVITRDHLPPPGSEANPALIEQE